MWVASLKIEFQFLIFLISISPIQNFTCVIIIILLQDKSL